MQKSRSNESLVVVLGGAMKWRKFFCSILLMASIISACAVNIIETPAPFVEQIAPTAPGSLEILMVPSADVVQLHVYDSVHRHVGLGSDGQVQMEIPKAIYAVPALAGGSIAGARHVTIERGDLGDVYIVHLIGLGSGTFDLFLEVPDRNSQAMYHTTYISVPVTAGATFTLNVRSDTNFALQTTMDTPIAPTAIWTTTLRNLSLNVATPELAVGDLVAFKQAYFEARRGAVEWAKDAVIIGAHTWHTMGTAQTKREALNQDGKAAQWLFTVATTHKMSEIYVVNGIAGSVGIDGVPGNDFIFDEPLSPEWLKQQEIRADEVIDSEIVVRVVKQRDLGGWELTEMRLDGNQWRLHFESPQRSRYIVVNAKTGEVLSDTETSTS